MYVTVSPTSSSLELSVPMMPPSIFSSMTLAERTTPVGASLVLATLMVKVSLIALPAASVAVTCMLIEPTSAFNGVPVKAWVVASKLSQEGRAEPSLKIAE